MKTEKTHIGTLVELWLQREFAFADSEELDYQIAGYGGDAKWSRDLYEWEIPLEMYTRGDKIAMVVWANEYTNAWAAGLIGIADDLLVTAGQQRDKKRHLNSRGRDSILWVQSDRSMIKNTLLHLPLAQAEQIARASSGQAPVNLLFTLVQGELVNRASVIMAAQQVDAAKRVRDARGHLAPAGPFIFGHYAPHPWMAVALGLPARTLGRFVSACVAPANDSDTDPQVEIAGSLWRLARDSDPVAHAPAVPRPRQRVTCKASYIRRAHDEVPHLSSSQARSSKGSQRESARYQYPPAASGYKSLYRSEFPATLLLEARSMERPLARHPEGVRGDPQLGHRKRTGRPLSRKRSSTSRAGASVYGSPISRDRRTTTPHDSDRIALGTS